MGLRRKSKKTPELSTPEVTTPDTKSVDAMIDEKPAHSTSAMREYLRDLIQKKPDEGRVIRVKKGKK